MSKAGTDKVVLSGKVEGTDEVERFRCDLAYLAPDRPVAVLEWPSSMELHGAQFVLLDPSRLSRSSTDAAFQYSNGDSPIPVPKELSELPPQLTHQAFRRGIFHAP